MSKFIAFVAALLVSTLSFAQQFITFTKEKVEPREGLAISVLDTTALYFDVNDTAWYKAAGDPGYVAVIDMSMTIEDVLNQGYLLEIIGTSTKNSEQYIESSLVMSDFYLYKHTFGNQTSFGGIEYVAKSDEEYSDFRIENLIRMNGLRHEHRKAASNIIKI